MVSDVDRRTVLTVAGAVATTALAGCSGDGSDEEGTEPATTDEATETATEGDGTTDGGELQMMINPIETLDPIGATGPRDAWVNWQLYESLFTYEEGRRR